MCCLEAGPLPSRMRPSVGHPLGKGRGTATRLQHRQEGLTGPGHPGPPAGWGKGGGPRVLAPEHTLSRSQGARVTEGTSRPVAVGGGGGRGCPRSHRDTSQATAGGLWWKSRAVTGTGASHGGGDSPQGPSVSHKPRPTPQHTAGCEEQHRLVAPPSHAQTGDQAQRPQALPPPPAGCSPKSSVGPRHTPA